MSITPFSARLLKPESESRRARLTLLIVTLGIAATLLAYSLSPPLRHAVSHAAHSVKHAVSRVLDHDTAKPARARRRPARAAAPARSGASHTSTPNATGNRTTVTHPGYPSR